MIPTRNLISELLRERARWARVYGLDSSRVVYNPLIRLHIRGIKENRHTLNGIGFC